MIHEAYMPVYMGSRFLARDGTDRGSTRGPRGPKKDATRSVSYDAPVLCQSGPSQRPVGNPFVIASSHTDAASDDGDVD